MIDVPSILMLVFAGAILVVIFYLLKQLQQTKTDLQNQVTQLQQNVSQRFDANTQTLTGHLGIITNQVGNTSNLVAQMEGKLGQMQEAGRHIMDLAKQITSLQEILSSPKMRGGLGEFFLGDLLSQCLPAGSYREQYSFRSANKVDAAVFLGENILCIDSKFPLENFRRIFQTESEEEKKNLRKLFLQDVKKHVNTIAEKYILPDENTFDFALMYIPAENVYYELIVREDSNLYEHCLSKKVIPVSPNTFYAYLQVILMGLRGFQISEQAKSILGQLQQIQNDLERFDLDFSKIGLHLRNADKCFEASEGRLQRLKDKVASMGTSEIETPSPVLISAAEPIKDR
jgi:DNA recombination protein RmuC